MAIIFARVQFANFASSSRAVRSTVRNFRILFFLSVFRVFNGVFRASNSRKEDISAARNIITSKSVRRSGKFASNFKFEHGAQMIRLIDWLDGMQIHLFSYSLFTIVINYCVT